MTKASLSVNIVETIFFFFGFKNRYYSAPGNLHRCSVLLGKVAHRCWLYSNIRVLVNLSGSLSFLLEPHTSWNRFLSLLCLPSRLAAVHSWTSKYIPCPMGSRSRISVLFQFYRQLQETVEAREYTERYTDEADSRNKWIHRTIQLGHTLRC